MYGLIIVCIIFLLAICKGYKKENPDQLVIQLNYDYLFKVIDAWEELINISNLFIYLPKCSLVEDWENEFMISSKDVEKILKNIYEHLGKTTKEEIEELKEKLSSFYQILCKLRSSEMKACFNSDDTYNAFIRFIESYENTMIDRIIPTLLKEKDEYYDNNKDIDDDFPYRYEIYDILDCDDEDI